MTASSASTFSCRDVTVRYGQFCALDGVSIDFGPGQITGLIGPNGAGKTTLLNVLSGLQKPVSGSVIKDGRDLSGLPPHRRAREGVARSFQILNIYPTLTVYENARLAVQRRSIRFRSVWQPVAANKELGRQTEEHLEVFGLLRRSADLAGTLSHGEQRCLELALSTADNPKVLLLDEPLAGVGHGETERVQELLGRVVRGRTSVLVEHNMDALMTLAHRVVCLVAGRVLASGPPEDVRANPQVRSAYLGE